MGMQILPASQHGRVLAPKKVSLALGTSVASSPKALGSISIHPSKEEPGCIDIVSLIACVFLL